MELLQAQELQVEIFKEPTKEDYDIVDQYCDSLFKTAPIAFKPRPGNDIDKLIKSTIDKKKIKMPIQALPQQDK